jgi:hypothetical protein
MEKIHLISSSLSLTNNLITGIQDVAVWALDSDLEMINNTITGNESDAIFLHDSCLARIYKNIIVLNQGAGISGTGTSVDEIDYNNVWGNAMDYFELVLPGLHDISEDPLFEDTGTGNYHLQAGSPCIDGGDPDPNFNDPDGN